jgi:hypothetical protein
MLRKIRCDARCQMPGCGMHGLPLSTGDVQVARRGRDGLAGMRCSLPGLS